MKNKIIKKSIIFALISVCFFLFSATSVFAVENSTSSEPTQEIQNPISINENLLGFSRERIFWFKDTIFKSVGTVTDVGLWVFVGLLGIVVVVKVVRYFLD